MHELTLQEVQTQDSQLQQKALAGLVETSYCRMAYQKGEAADKSCRLK